MRYRCAVARASLLVALLVGGCTLDPVELEGKDCPCAAPWTCDLATRTCTRRAPLDGGDTDAAGDGGTDGGMDAGSSDAGGIDAPTDAGNGGDGGDGGSLDPYATAVLADGPLAYWRLDEPAGSATVEDATGNGNDGLYLGGFSLEQDGIVAGNGAVALDGSTGRLNFGDRFDFAGTSPFTLEAWIRPRALTDRYPRVFTKEGNDAAGRQGYTVFVRMATVLSSPNTAAVERWRDQENPGAPVTDTPIPLDSFTHLVARFDGARSQLFLNGVEMDDQASTAELVDNGGPFVIGAQSTESNDFFDGVVDEVAVYDYALPDARVAAHYDAAP